MCLQQEDSDFFVNNRQKVTTDQVILSYVEGNMKSLKISQRNLQDRNQ